MATESKVTERGLEKTIEGVVVSDKMQKTVVVSVQRQVRHAKYGKFLVRTAKYLAHDEKETAGVGDTVEITQTRPLSKNKNWRVSRVLKVAAE